MRLSRKNALRTLARTVPALTAALALLPSPGRAASVTKKAARYRNYPYDDQWCNLCSHFIANGGKHGMGRCQIVQGSISVRGWCRFWRAR